jgi:hypothetical protein
MPDLSDELRTKFLEWFTEDADITAADAGVGTMQVSRKFKDMFKQFKQYLEGQLGIGRVSIPRTTIILAEVLKGVTGDQIAQAVRGAEIRQVLMATNRQVQKITFRRDFYKKLLMRELPTPRLLEWLRALSNNEAAAVRLYENRLHEGFVHGDLVVLNTMLEGWVHNDPPQISIERVVRAREWITKYEQYSDLAVHLAAEQYVQDNVLLSQMAAGNNGGETE